MLRTLNNANLYNQIEYRAYKYAGALAKYVSNESSRGNVYVIAHSMGAVVSSEAFRLGAPISKLEVMDGAISGSCFDINTAHYASASAADDPDLSYHSDGTVNGGYRGYFQNLPSGKVVNFYNLQDTALNNWQYCNEISKGGVGYPGDPLVQPAGTGGFYYNASSDDGSYTPNNCVWRYYVNSHSSHYNRYVPDIHESMAFMAFSRSVDLGQEKNIAGPVGHTHDMQNEFFGSSETGHSPGMDRNIQTTGVVPLFQTLMSEAPLTPAGP